MMILFQGYLERPRKFRSMIDILSQNGQSCAHCNTTQAPMWRKTPSGARICDFCGLRLRKRGMQLSPQKKDQTITGSVQEADNKDEEVTDDLKFLLGNDRLQVEQTMKKYADEISASLGLLEQQLEGFLDNVTSKCRSMTFFEKQSLWSLIKDLPPENFDRVVEIIKRSRGLDQRDENDILVDLEDTDNAVLWRLYYYAKAVENARNLVG
uniref:GATA-type domain-containing protein n=1 Tax=Kalanchoe fedtschenkoi TaxID=63787 RepID=A0A7N0T7H4_KALFE